MIDLSKEFHPYPKNQNLKKELKKNQLEAETMKKEVKKKKETISEIKKKTTKKQTKIKQKSKKLAKLERNRFSILTDNLNICYICNKRKKDDLHEVFGGSNRQKSMKCGLVIPICRTCHKQWDIDENLRKEIQQKAKEEFIKDNTKEKFREEFGKNYL